MLLSASLMWSEQFAPADEVRAAVEDLRLRVPAAEWSETRYLSLYALPIEQWSETRSVVGFVANSLSRNERIVRPEVVEGSHGRLLRLSLARYGWPGELWEALAGQDPYWHLRTQVIDPESKRTREVYTDGGWVDLTASGELRRMTGSGGAVLRADFFVARTATTARGGLYYEFAGIPATEREFFEGLGVDLTTIGRLRADAGANVIRSRVTRKMRRVVRRQGPLGGAWQTYDVERNTAERDPIRNPLAFVYDASEHIAAKRNGLHVFALYDRKGALQRTVPDVIAKDLADAHGDGIVVPMLSCVRCHVEDGIRGVRNDQARLLERGVELFAEQKADADRLAAFYLDGLNRPVDRDREDYAEAVAEATGGWSARETAAGLDRVYRRYATDLVTDGQAAREVGVDVESFGRAVGASTDAVLLGLSAGIEVQREQWEAAFAEAATLATRVK